MERQRANLGKMEQNELNNPRQCSPLGPLGTPMSPSAANSAELSRCTGIPYFDKTN